MPRILDALARLVPRRPNGPAETKASRVGPLIALDTLARPVWAPREYATFAREGFMQNAIVYRSVRMIAEAAASVPLLLYEGPREVEEHPLLDLLRRPSADHTGTDFLEAWYGYLLVSGNAYAEVVAIGGEVRELYMLRSDRMKVIPGAAGWPEGYEYTAGGESIRFTADVMPGVRPILHMRLFHPANDHYGMSPIEAAATAIDIHNAASQWNKALLDNSARPSGALVTAASGGHMTVEQFERLKSELETSYTGARQAGRPLLLEGGLDWKPLSLTPKDMDFIEAKNTAAREIALALGVPPMLLGIPGDNTYSNYQEAQRAFWRQTVLPLVSRTAGALSCWLSPAWDRSFALRPDLDQIEALAPEREALWARMERTTFLTANEKRAAVGYDPLEEVAPQGPFEPSLQGSPLQPSLKYSPDQPRVPAGNSDGGQWTDGGGGSGSADLGGTATSGDGRVLSDAPPDDVSKPGTQLAQASGGRGRQLSASVRPVMVRGLEVEIAEPFANEAEQASERLESALRRVRELDPSWEPLQSLRSGTPPTDIPAYILGIRMEAQEVEARLTVLERGGVPLGFNTREAYQGLGRTVWRGLEEAGYSDAVPFLRGSSVTGYSYETGKPFDVGRRSDYDLAIVSPELFRLSQELGVRIRGGTRTEMINPVLIREFRLDSLLESIRKEHGRRIGIVIYQSRDALTKRGPFLEVP